MKMNVSENPPPSKPLRIKIRLSKPPTISSTTSTSQPHCQQASSSSSLIKYKIKKKKQRLCKLCPAMSFFSKKDLRRHAKLVHYGNPLTAASICSNDPAPVSLAIFPDSDDPAPVSQHYKLEEANQTTSLQDFSLDWSEKEQAAAQALLLLDTSSHNNHDFSFTLNAAHNSPTPCSLCAKTFHALFCHMHPVVATDSVSLATAINMVFSQDFSFNQVTSTADNLVEIIPSSTCTSAISHLKWTTTGRRGRKSRDPFHQHNLKKRQHPQTTAHFPSKKKQKTKRAVSQEDASSTSGVTFLEEVHSSDILLGAYLQQLDRSSDFVQPDQNSADSGDWGPFLSLGIAATPGS